MESAKQLPSLDLWLHDVQSYIYRSTNEFMKQAGFQFNRSGFCYKRKNKESLDELSFIFLNHFPVKCRISFQLEIWHPKIRYVKEYFMNEILIKESNLCSIIMFMKDFPSHDPQQEIVNDYSICDHKDLFMVAGWLTQTLQDEILPFYDQLNSISCMDDFFTANPDWSLNTHSGGNICTDLIVSKLNRRRDFSLRYQQLMHGLQQKIENRPIKSDCRELLSLCYESMLNHKW
ncbi:MAG TPA: hypothetical protein VIL90_00720 [Puia sp.]